MAALYVHQTGIIVPEDSNAGSILEPPSPTQAGLKQLARHLAKYISAYGTIGVVHLTP